MNAFFSRPAAILGRLLMLVALVSLLTPFVAAQERAPAQLFEAAQCLATDPLHWVDVSNKKELVLAYLPEGRSFNGARFIDVVVYDSPKHDQGFIFDIRVREEGRKHIYSIENNAAWKKLGDEYKFDEPPLGGNFRQNQMVSILQQVHHHHKWYEAQVKQLVKPNAHLRCESSVEDVPPGTKPVPPAAPTANQAATQPDKPASPLKKWF